MVALTGWGQDEDRQRSLEAGFDTHLVKPVDHAVLMRLLAAGANGPSITRPSPAPLSS
jgi:CheY-like chemotaxis protein